MAERITHVDKILTWCLQVIEEDGWTVEDCLAHHASLQQELEPMLRAALALRQGKYVVPSAAFHRDAKLHLQLRLQASNSVPRQQPVTFSKSLRSIGYTGTRFRQRRFAMATIIAVIALVLSTVFGGVIYAADVSGPGDTLHGVDLAIEDFLMRLTSNDSSLAKLKLKLASERLEEAEIVLEEGASPEEMDAALAAFYKIIVELEALQADGDLTPAQQTETQTAIAALKAARQASGLHGAADFELEDDELTGEIESVENDNEADNNNSADNINGDNDNDDDTDNDNSDDDNDIGNVNGGDDNDNSTDNVNDDDDNDNDADNNNDSDDNDNSTDNVNDDDDNDNSADNVNDDDDDNDNSADNVNDDDDDNDNDADNNNDSDDNDNNADSDND